MIGEKKVTIEGKGAETLKEAEEFVKNYFDKNPRKPHKSTAKLEKELKTLFDDSRIKKILRTGRPSAKDLEKLKEKTKAVAMSNIFFMYTFPYL